MTTDTVWIFIPSLECLIYQLPRSDGWTHAIFIGNIDLVHNYIRLEYFNQINTIIFSFGIHKTHLVLKPLLSSLYAHCTMEDIEFSYIGEEETLRGNLDLN